MTVTHNIILVLFFCLTNIWALSQVDIESNNFNEGDYKVKLFDDNSFYSTLVKNNVRDPEKVDLQVYYESLCPGCKDFDVNSLGPVIDTMGLHLNVLTYPFGNARIINDTYVRCQHGPPECYGNKLHACALDKLEHTNALLYNICLMNSGSSAGSDDESADRCGKSMNIDSQPIKECAKGARGMKLLLHYGEESEKADFSYVPYVLINGKVFAGDDFKKAVCDAFVTPPPSCE